MLIGIFILYFTKNLKKGYFTGRIKLIISLLIAGCINSGNNAISTAAITIYETPLSGSSCIANGFIGQWTVQAGDFSTLSIALVTSYVSLHKSPNYALNVVEKWLSTMLFTIWGTSLSTAVTGHFVVGYKWTGTWCWFSATPLPLSTYVRYFLTHGPRIVIFVLIIVAYTYLYCFFRVKLKFAGLKKDHSVNRTVNQILIYPVFYVLLWSGGMANRFLDATTGSTEVTRFLQSFTQLIPFADSMLFIASNFVKMYLNKFPHLKKKVTEEVAEISVANNTCIKSSDIHFDDEKGDPPVGWIQTSEDRPHVMNLKLALEGIGEDGFSLDGPSENVEFDDLELSSKSNSHFEEKNFIFGCGLPKIQVEDFTDHNDFNTKNNLFDLNKRSVTPLPRTSMPPMVSR
ncbi:hypothetical protein HK099_008201 [Clydaea vesicula]|uniref:Glucose receptor Git3-like N-terminal domain-containing protein n=1 Tax=Clydaea vesicula TaxID=447962 RepID=A0AAD5U6C1_9FUNG|nr:hypothetical protein HK099_008201 [Clydaea vesicula]